MKQVNTKLRNIIQIFKQAHIQDLSLQIVCMTSNNINPAMRIANFKKAKTSIIVYIMIHAVNTKSFKHNIICTVVFSAASKINWACKATSCSVNIIRKASKSGTKTTEPCILDDVDTDVDEPAVTRKNIWYTYIYKWQTWNYELNICVVVKTYISRPDHNSNVPEN